jgi:hypothetical protein
MKSGNDDEEDRGEDGTGHHARDEGHEPLGLLRRAADAAVSIRAGAPRQRDPDERHDDGVQALVRIAGEERRLQPKPGAAMRSSSAAARQRA